MSAETTVFFNCRLLRGYELVCDELWIRNGQIVSAREVAGKADKHVDCHNAIIAPGFIDLQVNGAHGVDFLTYPDLPQGLAKVSKELPQSGVTSYCPTLISSPPDYFHRTLPQIPATKELAAHGTRVLGVHVEGPFISPQKKGAHPVDCIVGFGEEKMETVEKMYGDLINVKIITLAPEHEHSLEVIKKLSERGIVVSLGHSTTDLETAEKSVQAGASMITHLFNAMPAFHHRDPSLPGLLASSEIPEGRTVYYGIISDGIHTNQAALRIAYRMSPEGLVLVTDALAPMGLPPGDYHLGKQPITVSDTCPKVATVKGTDTLCGCVETMDHCIRHFVEVVGCSPAFALAAATLHPALCVKMTDSIGTLDVGTFADFVILDDSLHVLKTYVGGELVFEKSSGS